MQCFTYNGHYTLKLSLSNLIHLSLLLVILGSKRDQGYAMRVAK
jgi:hypothetical protein